MNLKPIAAAVCVLSFAATPVFADHASNSTGAVAVPPMTKVGETGKLRNQVNDDQTALQERALQAQEMDAILENNNGVLVDQDPALGNEWFKRIKISGSINFDGRISSRSSGPATNANGGAMSGVSQFSNGYTSGFSLNDSVIQIDAQVNDWTKAHISFTGGDNNQNFLGGPDLTKNSINNNFIDEAWVTIGDLNKVPVYFTAGRMYADFGNYQTHQLTQKLTTDLTQTQGNIAKLGFESNGFYGGAYAMDGLPTREANGNVHPNRLQNGGADLGYAMSSGDFKMDIGASYLYNMADVNLISNFLGGAGGSYRAAVGGLSGHGNFQFGPFSLDVNGVTALNKFNTADLTYKGEGAQPWAAGGELGYNFPVMNHDTKALISYQYAGESVNLALPEQQMLAGYQINLNKLTDVEFQVIRNVDYSKSNGGTGRSDWEGAVRLSIRV